MTNDEMLKEMIRVRTEAMLRSIDAVILDEKQPRRLEDWLCSNTDQKESNK
jgi:hypothetical protein